MDKIDKNSTLEEVKQFLAKNFADKGCTCPACGQNVQQYKKKIDSLMATYLIKLHKLSEERFNSYFHVEQDLDVPLRVGGSWAKLRWWGLIEEQPKDEATTSSRTSGYWKITPRGASFVKGEITLPKYVKLYNGKCRGAEGEQININDCLGDKFDYKELMST